MSSDRSNILLTAEDLYIGESVRGACPWCSKDTFTVTRAELGVLYNCYRDSCRRVDSSAGFIGIDRIAGLPPKREKPQRRVRFYDADINMLAPVQHGYLQAVYGLTPKQAESHGIRYAPHFQSKMLDGTWLAGRYVLPLMDPRGYTRGHDLHTWNREAERKSIIYPHQANGAMVSWHHPHTTYIMPNTVVLVEDIMSAIKVAGTGRMAVALMGTSVSPDALEELMAWTPAEVIVALDADATDTAYQFVWDHKILFPHIRVATLHCDVKDMKTDAEIKETLYG